MFTAILRPYLVNFPLVADEKPESQDTGRLGRVVARPSVHQPLTKLNQGQGGMCIRLRRGIGLGIWQECFGP